MPPKKVKPENNSKWSATKRKSKLKRRSACDVMKGTPRPRLDARLVKNELEAFLLYINENMIIILFLRQTKITLFLNKTAEGNKIQDFIVVESSQCICCKFIFVQ